jgi:hypothetical protein
MSTLDLTVADVLGAGTFVPFEEALEKLPERISNRIAIERGCWQWTGPLRGGYGRAILQGGIGRREQLAHRSVWTLLVGYIPENMTLDHLCRNRGCVNPEHLELVTLRENILRGEGVAARRARQTHCKRGHAFTTENTYRYSNGRRECLTCRRNYRRSYYAENSR